MFSLILTQTILSSFLSSHCVEFLFLVQQYVRSRGLSPGHLLLLTPPSGRHPPSAPTPSAWDPPPAGCPLESSQPLPLGATGTRAHSPLSWSAAGQGAPGKKQHTSSPSDHIHRYYTVICVLSSLSCNTGVGNKHYIFCSNLLGSVSPVKWKRNLYCALAIETARSWYS